MVTIVGVFLIAVIAEVVEFMLAGRFAQRYGGSRRAGWGAIIGGMVGAFMGVPIPIIGSVIGAFVGFFAAFADIHEVIELTNIGTLFAFILVAGGVLVLRVREPDRDRPFRVPAAWVTAPAAILTCGYLMLQLPGVTWLRFVVWLGVGLLLYALYGTRRSALGVTRER